MSRRRPPIVALAQAGVEDTVRAVRASPWLFACLLCAAGGEAYVDENASDGWGLPETPAFVLTLATSAAVTSAVAVTLHRSVILSETNSIASLAGRWRAMLDFATVLFGAQFLIFLPSFVAFRIWERQDAMPGSVVVLCVGFAILGFVALLRHVLVFPAIAIEAEDRSLRGAAEAAGRVVPSIVLACALAATLLSLIAALVASPVLLAGLKDAPFAAMGFRMVVEVATSAAMVAIVSRAYLWRAGRWPETAV